MDTTRRDARPVDLAGVSTLAHLLERLERSATPVDADQYRMVARRLADALAALPSTDALPALLDAYPALAEIYENLQYRHAGLVRAPLGVSMATEAQARELIARAAGRRPPSA